MDKFSFHRLGLLLKMEWVKNKKFFLIFSVLVFVGIIIGTAFKNGLAERYVINDLSNDVVDYLVTFFLPSWLIFSSFSFREFHKREKSVDYLQLPSSTTEKFTAKVLIYFLFFPLVFGVIFFVGVNTSIYLWDSYTVSAGINDRLYTLNYPNARPFNYITIDGIISFFTRGRDIIFLFLALGFTIIGGSFSFFSSLSFGRFNIFHTIILSISYFFITTLVVVMASHLILPEQTFGFDNAFRYDREITMDVPFSLFTVVLMLHLSGMVFLIISYFRLKEKEV